MHLRGIRNPFLNIYPIFNSLTSICLKYVLLASEQSERDTIQWC